MVVIVVVIVVVVVVVAVVVVSERRRPRSMAGGKKKAVKMTWQEAQAQFGSQSRNPLDNLPTSSRGYDASRDFRGALYAERERRERRDEQDEGPSRADEATVWRSAGSAATSAATSSFGRAGSFADRDRGDAGRSDDGMWRSSQAPSSFGSSSRRDEPAFERRRDDADVSERPRLNLQKPSQVRVQAALEEQQKAKAALAEQLGAAKPTINSARPSNSATATSDAKPRSANPFGDAKPVLANTDAKPIELPARPTISLSRATAAAAPAVSDRFARPTSEAPRRVAPTEPSSRFERPSDAALPVRPSRAPEVVKIVPSLPPKRTVVAPASTLRLVDEKRRPERPKKVVTPEPVPTVPVQTALATAMADVTWISADELADSIAHVSLDSDDAIDALASVLALSLIEKTLLLPSAVVLLPKAKVPVVFERTLRRVVPAVPVETLETIVGDVDVVAALGIDATLKRHEIMAILKNMGLEALAPKEDVAGQLTSMFREQTTTQDVVLKLLHEKFPKGKCRQPSLASSASSLLGWYSLRDRSTRARSKRTATFCSLSAARRRSCRRICCSVPRRLGPPGAWASSDRVGCCSKHCMKGVWRQSTPWSAGCMIRPMPRANASCYCRSADSSAKCRTRPSPMTTSCPIRKAALISTMIFHRRTETMTIIKMNHEPVSINFHPVKVLLAGACQLC